MATRMKKLWFGILGVSLALVSIQWLPPDVFPYREPVRPSHEELHARALNQDLLRTNAVLQRIRWVKDMEAYTAANVRDGVVVRGAGAITQEAIDGQHERLVQYLNELPGHDPRSIYGMFWMPIAKDGHPEVSPRSLESNTEYYIDMLGDRPYCFAVAPAAEGLFQDRHVRRVYDGETRYNAQVGPCRLVLRYGMPGERMMSWLESGALTFGYSTRTPGRDYTDYFGRRRGPFGRMYSRAGQQIGVDQCLGGIKEVCLRLVLDPQPQIVSRSFDDFVVANSPVRSSYRYSALGSMSWYLFHDLETEFGMEAFKRFWTADQDPQASFETAFGVEMDDWLVSWVDKQMTGYVPGPGLTLSARFSGLLLISLLGLGTGLLYRRRKVA